jgi:hypothetical protein
VIYIAEIFVNVSPTDVRQQRAVYERIEAKEEKDGKSESDLDEGKGYKSDESTGRNCAF